jgi:hypothetical protein
MGGGNPDSNAAAPFAVFLAQAPSYSAARVNVPPPAGMQAKKPSSFATLARSLGPSIGSPALGESPYHLPAAASSHHAELYGGLKRVRSVAVSRSSVEVTIWQPPNRVTVSWGPVVGVAVGPPGVTVAVGVTVGVLVAGAVVAVGVAGVDVGVAVATVGTDGVHDPPEPGAPKEVPNSEVALPVTPVPSVDEATMVRPPMLLTEADQAPVPSAIVWVRKQEPSASGGGEAASGHTPASALPTKTSTVDPGGALRAAPLTV